MVSSQFTRTIACSVKSLKEYFQTLPTSLPITPQMDCCKRPQILFVSTSLLSLQSILLKQWPSQTNLLLTISQSPHISLDVKCPHCPQWPTSLSPLPNPVLPLWLPLGPFNLWIGCIRDWTCSFPRQPTFMFLSSLGLNIISLKTDYSRTSSQMIRDSPHFLVLIPSCCPLTLGYEIRKTASSK